MDLSKWSTYWQQDGLPPWDSNNPCSQLINWLESETLSEIEKSDALELGCGSGRNTIYMQQNGFNNVVGVDIVPEAIEICKKNEQVIKDNHLVQNESKINWITDDLFSLSNIEKYPNFRSKFNFIFDLQCFHAVRKDGGKDDTFVQLVYDLLKIGGYFLVITGNANKDEENVDGESFKGPSKLTKDELVTPFTEFVPNDAKDIDDISKKKWIDLIKIEQSRFDPTSLYTNNGTRLPPLCWVALFQKRF